MEKSRAAPELSLSPIPLSPGCGARHPGSGLLARGLLRALGNLTYLAGAVDEGLPLNRWKVLASAQPRFLYVGTANRSSPWFNPGAFQLPADPFDAVRTSEMPFASFVRCRCCAHLTGRARARPLLPL